MGGGRSGSRQGKIGRGDGRPQGKYPLVEHWGGISTIIWERKYEEETEKRADFRRKGKRKD